MTAAAPLSRSTKVACAAPRDSASIPAAPEPANRSRTRASRRSGSRIAKSVCLTRSPSGRVASPGASSRVPRAVPAMTRPASARRHAPSPVPRRPPDAASHPRARRSVPDAAAPSARRRRAAPRHAPAHGRQGRDARRPGATRRAAAGTRSGRDPARRPPCAARSPSRRGRSRRSVSATASQAGHRDLVGRVRDEDAERLDRCRARPGRAAGGAGRGRTGRRPR